MMMTTQSNRLAKAQVVGCITFPISPLEKSHLGKLSKSPGRRVYQKSPAELGRDAFWYGADTPSDTGLVHPATCGLVHQYLGNYYLGNPSRVSFLGYLSRAHDHYRIADSLPGCLSPARDVRNAADATASAVPGLHVTTRTANRPSNLRSPQPVDVKQPGATAPGLDASQALAYWATSGRGSEASHPGLTKFRSANASRNFYRPGKTGWPVRLAVPSQFFPPRQTALAGQVNPFLLDQLVYLDD